MLRTGLIDPGNSPFLIVGKNNIQIAKTKNLT